MKKLLLSLVLAFSVNISMAQNESSSIQKSKTTPISKANGTVNCVVFPGICAAIIGSLPPIPIGWSNGCVMHNGVPIYCMLH